MSNLSSSFNVFFQNKALKILWKQRAENEEYYFLTKENPLVSEILLKKYGYVKKHQITNTRNSITQWFKSTEPEASLKKSEEAISSNEVIASFVERFLKIYKKNPCSSICQTDNGFQVKIELPDGGSYESSVQKTILEAILQACQHGLKELSIQDIHQGEEVLV